jgi:hypothetical protein
MKGEAPVKRPPCCKELRAKEISSSDVEDIERSIAMLLRKCTIGTASEEEKKRLQQLTYDYAPLKQQLFEREKRLAEVSKII